MVAKLSGKIKSLLSLLDDEDETIAVEAMAELLFCEAELGAELASLQESDNPLIRKRVHQLQAALTLRRRRRHFYELLQAGRVDLIDGLIEVHLQWFDNDSKPGLLKLWAQFSADAAKLQITSLQQLSYFMRKRGMTAVNETTLQPDNYCLGTILENNYGSAAVLCGIAWEIATAAGLELRMVRVLAEFGLLDGDGNLLLPGRDWQLMRVNKMEECDFWERRSLLRFASAMLFSHAVNSDSFRYIQTIAQSLTGSPDGELPLTFPYPYFPAEEEDEATGEQPLDGK